VNYYDNGLGITADSLAYYREHRQKLGAFVAAEARFPGLHNRYPYCLELRDDRGNRILLSGFGAGYDNAASRGAVEVLIDAGFPSLDAQQVLRKREVTLLYSVSLRPSPLVRPSRRWWRTARRSSRPR
jgi:hypothetical protein